MAAGVASSWTRWMRVTPSVRRWPSEVLEDSPVAPGDAAELGDDAGAQEVGGVSPARRAGW